MLLLRTILIIAVWSRTLKRKQYLKVDGDGASAEIRENYGLIATVNGQNSTGK